jgi:beta-glucosidase
MSSVLKFSNGFLWGSAVAAYQVEGGIENSDWSRDFPAGRACDYYNRYDKYFSLAKDLGQNIHRLSIEWSRIEPEEGKFDREAIEHYKKMLMALRARGIKSMVTIWHWTNPMWFSQKGGWENSRSPEYFLRFANFAVSELDNLVDFWATLNEPTIYMLLAYLTGRFPPYKRSVLSSFRVYLNLKRAHKKAYREIHRLNNKAKAGIVYNFTYISSVKNENFGNRILIKIWHYLANRMFLNSLGKTFDYLGVNYYFHDTIEFNWRKFPFIRVTHEAGRNLSDIGWEIFPKGIYYVLKDLKKYNLPIYITENGIADAKDAKRARFIIDHLKWTHKAISEGVDVRGYLHWSLVDNFEWTYGFSQKFGLIELNPETLETKIRLSALEYAKICKSNEIIL